MKVMKKILIVTLLIVISVLGNVEWILLGSKTSNPNNYKTVGDIPAPWGYERCEGSDSQYCSYLRLLPLRRKGSEVMLYTGGRARFQSLNYAIVDIPLLSNAEQCADVCIRLRAEYLYYSKQYGNIHFKDVNGNTMRYSGGASRKSFENYLRRVYGVASTYSLSREMKTRRLSDMQPGDVFVYAAVDRPGNHKYGHAIMVVDVAENKKGKKAFLLAEGNTPARNIHIMRNFENPFHSPWFFLDDDADLLLLSVFTYKSKELRHF
jgi:hypothetical protein